MVRALSQSPMASSLCRPGLTPLVWGTSGSSQTLWQSQKIILSHLSSFAPKLTLLNHYTIVCCPDWTNLTIRFLCGRYSFGFEQILCCPSCQLPGNIRPILIWNVLNNPNPGLFLIWLLRGWSWPLWSLLYGELRPSTDADTTVQTRAHCCAEQFGLNRGAIVQWNGLFHTLQHLSGIYTD